MSGADLEEIEAVYRARFPAFVAFGTAALVDPDRAVDSVQDAFATAVRRRRSFRREVALEAWIWRIVVNKVRDRRRKDVREFLAAREHAVTGNGYEADRAVRAVISELPERQRETIFLRYYADMDYGTIARLLEISEGTVAATLNAAHANLRRRIEAVP